MTDDEFVTLRQYFEARLADLDRRNEQRFEASDKAVQAALQAAKEAVNKAEFASDKRFESVNEFRNTLSDQQRTFMARTEVVMLVAGLSERLGTLVQTIEKLQAERAGIKGGWGYAAGVIGLLLAVGSLIMIGIKFIVP